MWQTTPSAATLLGRLPLGEYLQSNSLANGTLSVAYQNVDHNIDGDALDLAMAYDVTTLFALYPSLNTVSVQVHENDDHASDVDRYQFDRQMVNSYLTQVSNNAITQATIRSSSRRNRGTRRWTTWPTSATSTT